MKPFFIKLPLPPSTNNLHSIGHGRLYNTKEYNKFLEDSARILGKQIPICCMVQLDFFVFTTELTKALKQNGAKQDCSNYIKAAEDALKNSGLLIDDNREYVGKVTSMIYTKKLNCVVIKVSEFKEEELAEIDTIAAGDKFGVI